MERGAQVGHELDPVRRVAAHDAMPSEYAELLVVEVDPRVAIGLDQVHEGRHVSGPLRRVGEYRGHSAGGHPVAHGRDQRDVGRLGLGHDGGLVVGGLVARQVVAPVARNQNGDTSESRSPADWMVALPVSVLRYGTHPVTLRFGGAHAASPSASTTASAPRARGVPVTTLGIGSILVAPPQH